MRASPHDPSIEIRLFNQSYWTIALSAQSVFFTARLFRFLLGPVFITTVVVADEGIDC
jgi:hypothetical protein